MKNEQNHALVNFKEALEIYREFNHSEGIIKCLECMAEIHSLWGEIPESQKYLQEAKIEKEKLDES